MRLTKAANSTPSGASKKANYDVITNEMAVVKLLLDLQLIVDEFIKSNDIIEPVEEAAEVAAVPILLDESDCRRRSISSTTSDLIALALDHSIETTSCNSPVLYGNISLQLLSFINVINRFYRIRG